MSNLTRFNNMFGETFFNDFFRPLPPTVSEKMPAIDVRETENAYVVKADLPGVHKDDIEVKLENGVLSINAETFKEDEEKEEKTGRLLRQERHYGHFSRQMSVGSDVNPDAIDATFSDGVLCLTLPKQEQEKGKEVSIEIH